MKIWAALGDGFKITPKFWVAILFTLVLNAFIGAVSTTVLPYVVVEGQILVPPITSVEEAAARFFPTMGVYFFSMAGSLLILGGTLGCLGQVTRKSPAVLPQTYLRSAKRWFLPMVRWGLGFGVATLGSGIVVAALLGFLWGILGQPEWLTSLIALGFSGTTFAVGLALIFSPFAFTARFLGVWKSFSESFRFIKSHPGGVVGLIFWISLFGALLKFVDLILAGGVGGIRTALGIASFAPGLPVFFFNLILGLPSAFLTAFIPVTLYSYYSGNTQSNPSA